MQLSGLRNNSAHLQRGTISPVGASAIIGNVSLGMPGREVFIKIQNDSEVHKSRYRFFSKNTVVLKVVIQSSSD